MRFGIDSEARFRANDSGRKAVPMWYHFPVPPKIRELIRELKAAVFEDRGGKGSQRNLRHPSGVRITLSGSTGSDAKPYQEQAVRAAIARVSK
jgi:predicted RNA binding protein YcfA (HicA-like mRNA interferase family)